MERKVFVTYSRLFVNKKREFDNVRKAIRFAIRESQDGTSYIHDISSDTDKFVVHRNVVVTKEQLHKIENDLRRVRESILD